MYGFDVAAQVAAFAQWIWGIGREEGFVFVLGWVCHRLKIVPIVRLNWRGMTRPYRVLFPCTMALLLAVPVLSSAGHKDAADFLLGARAVPYMSVLGAMAVAWMFAFAHERRRRGIIRIG